MQLPVRLDQYLKLAGAAQTGGHAKLMIQDGDVQVDGQVETRRGRKLRGGEQVVVEGVLYRVDPAADDSK
jgi:ribosome-associated protein